MSTLHIISAHRELAALRPVCRQARPWGAGARTARAPATVHAVQARRAASGSSQHSSVLADVIGGRLSRVRSSRFSRLARLACAGHGVRSVHGAEPQAPSFVWASVRSRSQAGLHAMPIQGLARQVHVYLKSTGVSAYCLRSARTGSKSVKGSYMLFGINSVVQAALRNAHLELQ